MAVTIATLGERALRRLGVAVVPAADRPVMTGTVGIADIATAALVWLGVVASDETPVGSDAALARNKVTAVHEGLVAQGIMPWGSDAIPRAASEDIVILTALHLAPSFGKQGDPAQEAIREARIRKLVMVARAPALAAEKVLAVHASLDARGKTRWSAQDIPDYLEDSYVQMAAFLLAPEFDLRPDPDAWARGELMVNRFIALPTSGETVQAVYF